MKTITKIKNWVKKDGIVKRGNKQVVDSSIRLTFYKSLIIIKNKMVIGHDDFKNYYCIPIKYWETLEHEKW